MSRPHISTQVFPLLDDPGRYTACRWDLSANSHRRAYWLKLFRQHFASLHELAVSDASARGQDILIARNRADGAREDFFGFLDVLATNPVAFGRLDINMICKSRERALRRWEFEDPYYATKWTENRAALSALQALLAEVDRTPLPRRNTVLMENIFAGNIFDLGAPETMALFESGRMNFQSTRDQLAARPWLVDDLDAWLARLEAKVHRCAVLFVDNAGFDVVLGMIPFARELLRRGTGVILTSNTTPALNDITHHELEAMIEAVARKDAVVGEALADGRLELAPSGNGTPLIDLSEVSGELAEAVRRRGVDLVVLEGMGRAIESNFDARFTCDTLKVAMLKDRFVAEEMGGEVYDLVLRFEPCQG